MGALRVVALLAALACSSASASVDDPQIDAAIRALRGDSSLKVRTQAAIVLGQRTAREGVQALRDAVASDQAAAVRIAAVTALGRIGDRRARSTLRHASAADPDASVRSAAARVLSGLGPVSLSIEDAGVPASSRAAVRDALARELAVRGYAVQSPAEVRLRPTLRVQREEAGGKMVIAVHVALAVVDGDGRVDLVEAGARATVTGAASDSKLASYSSRTIEAAVRALCDDLAAKLAER